MNKLLHYLRLSAILNISILGISLMNPVHASMTQSYCHNTSPQNQVCMNYSYDNNENPEENTQYTHNSNGYNNPGKNNDNNHGNFNEDN